MLACPPASVQPPEQARGHQPAQGWLRVATRLNCHQRGRTETRSACAVSSSPRRPCSLPSRHCTEDVASTPRRHLALKPGPSHREATPAGAVLAPSSGLPRAAVSAILSPLTSSPDPFRGRFSSRSVPRWSFTLTESDLAGWHCWVPRHPGSVPSGEPLRGLGVWVARAPQFLV